MALVNWSFVCGALTAAGTYMLFRWIHEKLNKKENGFYDDCIMFSPKVATVNCVNQSCNNFSCSYCNNQKFLAMINSAKYTLDICVYLITGEDITEIIVKVFRRGVFVRIIMDKQMSDEAFKSKTLVFMKKHIPIKMVDSGSSMMHNKFAIIDQKTVITGSFNWTRQGVFSNYENAVIIHNSRIVRKYSVYFHNTWYSF